MSFEGVKDLFNRRSSIALFERHFGEWPALFTCLAMLVLPNGLRAHVCVLRNLSQYRMTCTWNRPVSASRAHQDSHTRRTPTSGPRTWTGMSRIGVQTTLYDRLGGNRSCLTGITTSVVELQGIGVQAIARRAHNIIIRAYIN